MKHFCSNILQFRQDIAFEDAHFYRIFSANGTSLLHIEGGYAHEKATVTVTFDDEKLGALEFSLRKEHSSVQEHLEDALNALYEKPVPEPLREYLDSKAAPAAVKPKRPVKPAAPKP